MYKINTVSIIVPAYNEEGNLQLLAKEISNVMYNSKYKYEVLFVNDGSTDNSWEIICQTANIYPNIQGVDLAGNYGQTIALRAGINASIGDVIVAMDGDMQHDPIYIPQFLNYIEKGYDLVSGSKEKRPENFIKSFMSNIAHNAICRISGVNMKYFGATFKVYRRYLFDNVNLIGDVHRFIGALVARKGTRFIELPISIRERKAGKSNYKLSKALLVIVDLLLIKFSVTYMNKPFRLFGLPGLILFIIGIAIMGYYTFGAFFMHWFIGQNYQIEFISAIFLVLFAVILLSLGIIAQIGTHNYFSKNNQEPFAIREQTSTLTYNE